MKRIIQLLFVAIVIAVAVGYYFKLLEEDHITGDKIIGIAVLAFAFLLMPLFIYHRSKGKKLSDYTLTKDNLDKMNNKEGKNPENQ
ncbi:hypothetical protein OOZ15_15170 [Galbibacter sp. EGI 63066]|uniref:hypothetical protein n=1 Tax=Galbibacter sp. EGI 63066 TaxID=2993559 RepID=UPI002248795E|nr:hypothetical protein [Galbibacter sp. EGI 63066]MCX2681292.1 hypothetical protein [Galbibacter sp. EGI 63066]